MNLNVRTDKLMVDSVQFKIEGLEELLGKLESVTDDVKRKGGRSALRKAAQLIANKAKEGCPVSNALKGNMAIEMDAALE